MSRRQVSQITRTDTKNKHLVADLSFNPCHKRKDLLRYLNPSQSIFALRVDWNTSE
jgi:hypothetical protein